MQTRIIALVGIVCLASLGSTNAEEEEQSIVWRYASMSENEVTRNANDGVSFESLPQAAQQLLLSCDYETKGDYPHKSGSHVSAHGWWVVDSNYPSIARNMRT